MGTGQGDPGSKSQACIVKIMKLLPKSMLKFVAIIMISLLLDHVNNKFDASACQCLAWQR